MPMLGRLEIWVERHARVLSRVLVLAAVVLAFGLRTLHVADVVTRSPDERLYTQFAQRVALDGLGAYPQIFAQYASDPSQWIYPSPTRVVPVLLFSGVMKLTGSSSAQAGAAVSWALGIGSVLLLGVLARRFFGGFVAVVAAMLLASLGVELEFARRAWGESTASFLTLALMYAACALHAQPHRWRWRVAFFAAGLACSLTKETSLFAYALCGMWLVGCRLLQARDYVAAALLTLGGLFSVVAAFGVLVLLAGSTSHALAGLLHVFGNGLGSNDWGALNASGPWYRFGLLLWLMSPFTASMALLGAFAWATRFEPARAFAGLEPGARTRAGLALLLTLGFAGASAFGPNLQYLRIMAPANPSNCLLAAFGVRYLVTASEDWLRGKAYPLLLASLPVVFVLASFRDYALYRDVVVRSGMQDLTVPWLLAGIERREAHALAASAAAAPAAARGVAAETASDHLGRSLQHCRREEFAECVSAAQAALRLDPKLAEAWNNAAIGYAGLQLWDDAAHSALQAVRLRPDFQLAKNNLAWVTEEKAKRTAALEP